jgi:xanthine/uracil permease
VGEWEPLHRPLLKVTAVIVSVSLLLAGLGTVIQLVLAGR